MSDSHLSGLKLITNEKTTVTHTGVQHVSLRSLCWIKGYHSIKGWMLNFDLISLSELFLLGFHVQVFPETLVHSKYVSLGYKQQLWVCKTGIYQRVKWKMLLLGDACDAFNFVFKLSTTNILKYFWYPCINKYFSIRLPSICYLGHGGAGAYLSFHRAQIFFIFVIYGYSGSKLSCFTFFYRSFFSLKPPGPLMHGFKYFICVFIWDLSDLSQSRSVIQPPLK